MPAPRRHPGPLADRATPESMTMTRTISAVVTPVGAAPWAALGERLTVDAPTMAAGLRALAEAARGVALAAGTDTARVGMVTEWAEGRGRRVAGGWTVAVVAEVRPPVTMAGTSAYRRPTMAERAERRTPCGRPGLTWSAECSDCADGRPWAGTVPGGEA